MGGLTGTTLQQMQDLWEALLGQDYSRYRTCGRPYWDKTTADTGPVGGLIGTRLQQIQDLWKPYWNKTTADTGPVGSLTGTRLQQMQDLSEALLGHDYLWEALLGQDYSRCRNGAIQYLYSQYMYFCSSASLL